MTDTKKLREAAERATPGPWQERMWRGVLEWSDGMWNSLLAHGPIHLERDLDKAVRDMEFIAAANPQTILTLLDELDAARGAAEVLYETLELDHCCFCEVETRFRCSRCEALSHPTVQAARAK